MEFYDLVWYGFLSYAIPFIGTVGFLKMQQRHGMPINLGLAQGIATLFVVVMGAFLILNTNVEEFRSLIDFANFAIYVIMIFLWIIGAVIAGVIAHFISDKMK